jgi:hypothetical protein
VRHGVRFRRMVSELDALSCQLRRALPIAALVLGAFGLLGCGAKPVDLGRDPQVLWWTDYETADFSDWTGDGQGSTWLASGGTVDPSRDYARSGSYSMRSVVVSPGLGTQSAGNARRSGNLPPEAYYSAWFYIPAPITATDYWLFSKFRSRTVVSDPNTFVDVWDMDIRVQQGALHFALYSHDASRDEPALASPLVPIGRWFQLEAFLRPTPNASGRLSVWIDGSLLYDLVDTPTMPTTYVEWSVGGIAEVISPPGAALYVDDAAISTRRLGPDSPVFWRAE